MHYMVSVYLSERIFFISIKNQLSDYGRISCGVPQGSILGPLLFLIYVNDMSQAVNSNLLLYTDSSCLLFQHKDVEECEKVLMTLEIFVINSLCKSTENQKYKKT